MLAIIYNTVGLNGYVVISLIHLTPPIPFTPHPILQITDSEESVRVVKSAKTRAFESFETNVKSLRNAMRNNDHKTLMEEFDTLTKSMIKSKKVFESNGGIPRFLVRILCDLEDHVHACLADKPTFKKLKPAQGRALNRMKLSLKKFNEQYKGIMEEYRKNPVISESDASSSSSSSSSSEEEKDSDDDDDDSSSDSSSDDSSAADKKKTKIVKAKKDSDSDSVSSHQVVVLLFYGGLGDRSSPYFPQKWDGEKRVTMNVHRHWNVLVSDNHAVRYILYASLPK